MARVLKFFGCIAVCISMLTTNAFADQAPTGGAASAKSSFLDPLDTPALMRERAAERPLMAIARAGKRLVAVGSRGMIVTSEDEGKNWTQCKVPVQSDLLSVQFPTENDGWVVGHDGVVLHSADGGKTWVKQLDGRMAGPAFKAFYKSGAGGKENMAEAAVTSITDAMYGKAATGPKIPSIIDQNYKSGPALPFLDVWFDDTQKGYVVGAFGLIAGTTDGGKTWEPLLHRLDNGSLNLNAIRDINGKLYIVGEHGHIYQLDRGNGSFTKIDTGYIGSFFGIVGNADVLVAYGLTGTVYRSTNGGAKWESVPIPNLQTIAGGVTRTDGSFVLVNAAGQFLVGDKTGQNFRLLPAEKPMRMTGIVELDDNNFVVTGLNGVKTEALHDASGAK